jgi:hypothetical protein
MMPSLPADHGGVQLVEFRTLGVLALQDHEGLAVVLDHQVPIFGAVEALFVGDAAYQHAGR